MVLDRNLDRWVLGAHWLACLNITKGRREGGLRKKTNPKAKSVRGWKMFLVFS